MEFSNGTGRQNTLILQVYNASHDLIKWLFIILQSTYMSHNNTQWLFMNIFFINITWAWTLCVPVAILPCLTHHHFCHTGIICQVLIQDIFKSFFNMQVYIPCLAFTCIVVHNYHLLPLYDMHFVNTLVNANLQVHGRRRTYSHCVHMFVWGSGQDGVICKSKIPP